jgi:excinuclease UvrABC ATPase subunit
MDDVDMPCEVCGGSRFSDKAMSYRLNGLTIADALSLSASEASDAFRDVARATADAAGRMVRCGIGYVTLGQSLDSLSGGERQRLKPARELERPVGAYAFDEPTTGLHGRDISRLLGLFDELIDRGSSLVVVEHDLDVMAHADWLVDIGPGAGDDGGRIQFTGTPHDLVEHGTGPTADHLRRWVGAD